MDDYLYIYICACKHASIKWTNKLHNVVINYPYVHTCTTYPVSVCRPAPMVDRRAPIRIIHLVGKANSDTVKPPVLSPNLKNTYNSVHVIHMQYTCTYKTYIWLMMQL